MARYQGVHGAQRGCGVKVEVDEDGQPSTKLPFQRLDSLLSRWMLEKPQVLKRWGLAILIHT